jgi:hypothetical protein
LEGKFSRRCDDDPTTVRPPPSLGKNVENGLYERALPYVNPQATNPRFVDKVKVAHEVAKIPAQFDGMSELKEKVQQLVGFINECSGE